MIFEFSTWYFLIRGLCLGLFNLRTAIFPPVFVMILGHFFGILTFEKIEAGFIVGLVFFYLDFDFTVDFLVVRNGSCCLLWGILCRLFDLVWGLEIFIVLFHLIWIGLLLGMLLLCLDWSLPILKGFEDFPPFLYEYLFIFWIKFLFSKIEIIIF